MSFRQGDWVCAMCNNVNFSSRTFCNKHHCKAPRATADAGPPPAGGAPPMMGGGGLGGGGGVQGEIRKDDWICPSCSNHNYAHRTACNRCKVPKEMLMGGGMGPSGLGGGMGLGMGQQGMGGMGMQHMNPYGNELDRRGLKRPSDTLADPSQDRHYKRANSSSSCNVCGCVNHPDSPQCVYCGSPVSSQSGSTGGGESWLCLMCSHSNMGSAMQCGRCTAPKQSVWFCTVCGYACLPNQQSCQLCGGATRALEDKELRMLMASLSGGQENANMRYLEEAYRQQSGYAGVDQGMMGMGMSGALGAGGLGMGGMAGAQPPHMGTQNLGGAPTTMPKTGFPPAIPSGVHELAAQAAIKAAALAANKKPGAIPDQLMNRAAGGGGGVGAANAGGMPMVPMGGRPGDWLCPDCSNHNYAIRNVCNRCKKPKPTGA